MFLFIFFITAEPKEKNFISLLPFDVCLDLYGYLTVPDIESCLEFSLDACEAAQYHFYKRYRTLEISTGMLLTSNRNHITRRSLIDHLRIILQRTGQYINTLTIDYSSFYQDQDIYAINILVREYCTSLQDLTLIGTVKTRFRRMLPPLLNNLKSLKIVRFGSYPDGSFWNKYLSRCVGTLESLTLTQTAVTGECLQHCFPKLRSVTMVANSNLKYMDTDRFLSYNPGIISFESYWSPHTDDLVPSYLFSRLKEIERLRLSHCKIHHSEYKYFMELIKLTHLDLNLLTSGNRNANQFIRDIAENMPNLQQLAISLPAETEFEIETVYSFATFKKLVSFKLNSESRGLRLPMVIKSLEAAIHLRHLTIINYDCELQLLCQSFPNLEHLGLECTSTNGLAQISHLCLLKHLSLTLKKLDYNIGWFIGLLAKHSNIETLDLCMQPGRITFGRDAAELFSKFSRLRRLYMDNDLLYKYRVQVSGTIRELEISCQSWPSFNMEVHDLVFLINKAKALRKLTVFNSGLQEITPLKALAQLCPGVNVQLSLYCQQYDRFLKHNSYWQTGEGSWQYAK